MKIKRVIIKKLKALSDRDDLLGTDEHGRPLSSLCLRGINGSGKTTYLEAIASLWDLFHALFGDLSRQPRRLLRSASLVAMHLVELPGPAPEMWLVYGDEALWRAVPQRGDAPALGLLRHRRPVGQTETSLCESSDVLRVWSEAATRLELGGTPSQVLLPNVVWLGAENRFAIDLREPLSRPVPEPSFRWLARYRPSAKREGHIENTISAMMLVDRERFLRIAAQLHQIWPRLELLDRADPKTLRPLFRLSSGPEVTLDALSAGERALLISLFTIARWMTPGGIVLLDEPDLHQHLSLIRRNLAILERFVTHDMGGQMIVSSHAPEVWNHFRTRGSIIDLDADAPTTAGAGT